jgi:hypothetical protein
MDQGCKLNKLKGKSGGKAHHLFSGAKILWYLMNGFLGSSQQLRKGSGIWRNLMDLLTIEI